MAIMDSNCDQTNDFKLLRLCGIRNDVAGVRDDVAGV